MLLPRRVIFIFGLLIIEARDTAPHSEFDTLPTPTVAVSDVEQAEKEKANLFHFIFFFTFLPFYFFTFLLFYFFTFLLFYLFT